jgi:hypothetical protein
MRHSLRDRGESEKLQRVARLLAERLRFQI